jgi:hypothetical protein
VILSLGKSEGHHKEDDMMSRWMTGFLAVFLTISFASAAMADDHIVQEASRTYMGRTSPPRPSEVWLAVDRVYIKDGGVIIITRNDLKKRWTIMTRSKRYLEEDLAASAASTVREEKPFRIQEYGFNYEPSYDWTVDKNMPTETVDGRKCRKVVARGDADYAQEVREIWVTKDVPIAIKRAYEMLTKPNLDAQWQKIYERTPDLKEGFVVKSVVTSENPIAPTMVMVTRLTKAEVAPPPPGIYELPAGLQKVKSLEELYAR